MPESEVIPFSEIVDGTGADRFQRRGIIDLEWVQGGLKITAADTEEDNS